MNGMKDGMRRSALSTITLVTAVAALGALGLLMGACGDMEASSGDGGAYWTEPQPNGGGGDGATPTDPYGSAVAADAGSVQGTSDYYAGGPEQDAGPAPENPDATAAPDGNKFEYVGTNPFVTTEHDPISTFAADVDTASYDAFRKAIDTFGQLPPFESVRLEEFVNYFHYDYPAPPADAAEPFGVAFEAAPSPFADTTLLRVGLRGKDAPESEPKPANLVFLVDVSGSMSSTDKLPLVKTVLRETLTILEPGSRVAIVTYAGSVGTALDSTPIENKPAIEAAIDALASGGSTNGAGGIEAAYAQAEAHYVAGGMNHVLLCTDGDFNVGVSSNGGLVSLIEDKRKSGITLTVLGFGWGNLNDSMMEAVSNAGNGVYGIITDTDQAIAYVHDRMLSNLHYIAKDVKIQVAFNPALVTAYRLLGYEDRAIADVDFTNDKVDAGEVGAGHTVTALYELVLAGGYVPAVEGAPPLEDGPLADGEGVGEPVPEGALCEVRLRYKDVDATEDDPAYQSNFPLTPHMVSASLEETSGDYQWAVALAAFAEILKHSPYGDVANLDTIEALTTPWAGTDPDRVEFLGLLSVAKGLLTGDGTL